MASARLMAVLAGVCLLLAVVSPAAVSAAVYPPPTGAVPLPYSWETRWWNAQLDNFNFHRSNETFPLKYLINDTFFREGGPIFFYTGNEGPIELFAANTGFMYDMAPQFGAMLVFAEHRYYGESVTGNEDMSHLSAEQALADYALLLTSLKHNDTRIAEANVIAFGGSYGGMLSSWFRLKYPHVIAGAIAGSAPIWFFDSATATFDAGTYNRIASDDFRASSDRCFNNIARSWDAMVSDKVSIAAINSAFSLCPESRVASKQDIKDSLWPWLGNVYSTLPMGDYPAPAEFLGLLPAYPVAAACKYFEVAENMTDAQLIHASRQVVDLFYNASEWIVPGQGKVGACHDPANETGIASLGAGQQWPYQSCTEMVMPIAQMGPPNDLFYKLDWDLDATIAQCQAQFGVTPRPTWIMQQFGGPDAWKSASNIVFSNGDLDPWSGGGVLADIGANVVAVPVKGGAHHLDLRGMTDADIEGVTWARQQEVQWIERFLANPSGAIVAEDCEANTGIKKSAIALYSCVITAAFCLLVWLLFAYCAGPAARAAATGRPQQQVAYNDGAGGSGSGFVDTEVGYTSLASAAAADNSAIHQRVGSTSSPSKSHDAVHGPPQARLTVR
jgi:lysosomal Pro-X carboxypeptidase